MLTLGYAVAQVVEMGIGLSVMHRIYPEWRRDTWIFKGLFVVVCVILGLLYAWNACISFISTTALVGFNILLACVHCIFFRTSFLTAVLWQVLYGINIALLKMPAMIICGIAEQKTLVQVNRGARSFWELLWCLLIDILMILIFCKSDSIYSSFKTLLQQKRLYLSLVLLIQNGLLCYNMWLGMQGFQTIDLVVNVVFIICTALSMQYFLLYIAYQRSRSERDMLDMIQNLSQNHNYELQEFYNRSNQKLHDMKHYMLYIANCLENGDIEKGKSVVEEYLADLYDTKYQVWTGFSFLDYLLNYKKLEIDEKQIVFTLEIDLLEYPFEEVEMGVVLGNLLDNAIEAAEKCEVGKRNIHLCMRNINKMFLLNIKNSNSQFPQQKGKKFVTNKTDKYAHGLGVENVKRIVEKYEGSIEFEYDNEQFEVNILI